MNAPKQEDCGCWDNDAFGYKCEKHAAEELAQIFSIVTPEQAAELLETL